MSRKKTTPATPATATPEFMFAVGKVYARKEGSTTYECLCVAKTVPEAKNRKARAMLHHFEVGHVTATDGDKGWDLVEEALDV